MNTANNGFAWGGQAGNTVYINMPPFAPPRDRFAEALYWLHTRGYWLVPVGDHVQLRGPGPVEAWIPDALNGYLPILLWLLRPPVGADADPYTVLGLPPDAAPSTVKARYRSLMHIVHPDRHPQALAPTASDLATRYNRAYAAIAEGWAAKEQAG